MTIAVRNGAPVGADTPTDRLPAVDASTFSWFEARYAGWTLASSMDTPIYDQLVREAYPDAYTGRHSV